MESEVLAALSELDDIEAKLAFQEIDSSVRHGARVAITALGEGQFEVTLRRPFPSAIRVDYGRGASHRDALVDLWRNMYRVSVDG